MKTAPRSNRELLNMLSDSLFMFANLVANRAGSFAGGLTRSLALTAAAALDALFEVAGLDRFNSLHRYHTPLRIIN